MTRSMAARADRSQLQAGGMPAVDHSWPFLDETAAVSVRSTAFVDPLERTLDGSSLHSTQEICR